MRTKNSLVRIVMAGLLPLAATFDSLAWDYEGHRIINQLALASLPRSFPRFALKAAARERVAFLSGEPDRWRNTSELTLKHANAPDHFLDIELLAAYQLDPSRLSPFRYEFTAQLALGRAAHPQNFAPIEAHKDADRTRALIGFLPWAITEYEAKLRSAFSYLKEYESAGTSQEVANARENILYLMGVMGHYVGDGSQPLHTTQHHHGWVGDNPSHYSTNYSIHAWIDGGYIHQFALRADRLRSRLRPARSLQAPVPGGQQTNLFYLVMAYLIEQHHQVEPLFRLEKEGKLSGRREVSEEGYDFISGQLLNAAQMLGDLWLTAWQDPPSDMFLRTALAKRKAATAKGAQVPPP